MNGPQHYVAAEECMASAIKKRSPMLMDAAMIHALLANSAATAAAFAVLTPVEQDRDAEQWHKILHQAAEQAVPDTLPRPAPGNAVNEALSRCRAALSWCSPENRKQVISDLIAEAFKGDSDATPIYDAMAGQPPAGPLVACGARPYPAGSEGDDGTECRLPVDHDGPHDDLGDEPGYQADAAKPVLVRPYAANL